MELYDAEDDGVETVIVEEHLDYIDYGNVKEEEQSVNDYVDYGRVKVIQRGLMKRKKF